MKRQPIYSTTTNTTTTIGMNNYICTDVEHVRKIDLDMKCKLIKESKTNTTKSKGYANKNN